MSKNKTFLEQQRSEEIDKQKTAKNTAIGILLGAVLINIILGPILTVYAIGVFVPSVDLNWYTYLASVWFHIIITAKVKFK